MQFSSDRRPLADVLGAASTVVCVYAVAASASAEFSAAVAAAVGIVLFERLVES